MTAAEALRELEALGSEQTRKTYRRHGVTGPQFGVSYAHLGKLTKRIKVDHALAVALWASGNHDARVLATMVADPTAVGAGDLEKWVKELDNYALTDAFAKLAARTRHARAKAAKWTGSKSEWVASVGWALVGQLAMNDGDLPDDFFQPYLDTIEAGIHAAENRVRYTMNGALIAIGVRNPRLSAKALKVAAKIGTVEVDHGDTDCKTPDAAAYIRKVLDRKKTR